jgi:hypothetical protein
MYPYFVSSSLFMLFNLFLEEPSFYQLNGGWRIDPDNALIVEAITWRYSEPLGIPYGKYWAAGEHPYPGRIRDYGVGLAYQHFWWRGMFTTLHVTPFLHEYQDQDGDVLQRGLLLWMQGRAGWHLRFARERLFFEPSVAFNAWPIETHQPASFRAVDSGWPHYFLLEPGLNVGVNF